MRAAFSFWAAHQRLDIGADFARVAPDFPQSVIRRRPCLARCNHVFVTLLFQPLDRGGVQGNLVFQPDQPDDCTCRPQ